MSQHGKMYVTSRYNTRQDTTGVLVPISTTDIMTLGKDEHVQITIFTRQKWKTVPHILLFDILPLIAFHGSVSIQTIF